MTLKIKLKFILNNFIIEIPALLILIFLVIIFNFSIIIIAVFLIYFLLLLISIWLFYTYYKANKDQIIYLSKNELKVVDNNKNITSIIDINEIDRIFFIIPEVEMGYFPFDTFNYVKIILNNESFIIITNLMYDDIEDLKKELDENKIIVKKKFICILEL